MAKCAVISSAWMASNGRWDAGFWIKLSEMLTKRGIAWNDVNTVKDAIAELHKRGQFPTGSNWYPGKVMQHVECPSCMSWNVDAEETTIVRTIDAVKHTSYSASYQCRNCENKWSLQSGSNQQPS